MSLSLRNGIRSLVQAATPSSPASGFRGLYPRSDGWYDLSSAGVESKLADEPSAGWDLPAAYFRSTLTAARSGHLVNNVAALTTQREHLTSMWFNKGETVTTLWFASGGTGAGTPTNWWYTLRDANRVLLRQTNDQLTAAWGTNTEKPLALSSPYVIPSSGLYYVGIMVKATTVPTLVGNVTIAPVAALAPIRTGITADTALTTTAPSTAGAITADTAMPLCMAG